MSAGLPAASSDQRTKLHTRALGVIGVVADVLSLAGAVAGFLSNDVLLLTLGALAVLLISISWLWRRHTKPALCFLAAGCLCLGSVVTFKITAWQNSDHARQEPTAGSFQEPRRSEVDPTASPETSAVSPAQTDPAQTDPAQTDPAQTDARQGDTVSQTRSDPALDTATETDSTVLDSADSSPTVVVDETVILPRGAAIDVDRPAQRIAARHVDGATGDYDLYHDWGAYKTDVIQAVNGPNAYSYFGGNPTTAYFRCKDAMAANTPNMSSNAEFCFRTSAKRVAYLAVTQSRQDFAFVAHVMVWTDPPQ